MKHLSSRSLIVSSVIFLLPFSAQATGWSDASGSASYEAVTPSDANPQGVSISPDGDAYLTTRGSNADDILYISLYMDGAWQELDVTVDSNKTLFSVSQAVANNSAVVAWTEAKNARPDENFGRERQETLRVATYTSTTGWVQKTLESPNASDVEYYGVDLKVGIDSGFIHVAYQYLPSKAGTGLYPFVIADYDVSTQTWSRQSIAGRVTMNDLAKYGSRYGMYLGRDTNGDDDINADTVNFLAWNSITQQWKDQLLADDTTIGLTLGDYEISDLTNPNNLTLKAVGKKTVAVFSVWQNTNDSESLYSLFGAVCAGVTCSHTALQELSSTYDTDNVPELIRTSGNKLYMAWGEKTTFNREAGYDYVMAAWYTPGEDNWKIQQATQSDIFTEDRAASMNLLDMEWNDNKIDVLVNLYDGLNANHHNNVIRIAQIQKDGTVSTHLVNNATKTGVDLQPYGLKKIGSVWAVVAMQYDATHDNEDGAGVYLVSSNSLTGSWTITTVDADGAGSFAQSSFQNALHILKGFLYNATAGETSELYGVSLSNDGSGNLVNTNTALGVYGGADLTVTDNFVYQFYGADNSALSAATGTTGVVYSSKHGNDVSAWTVAPLDMGTDDTFASGSGVYSTVAPRGANGDEAALATLWKANGGGDLLNFSVFKADSF